MSPFGPVRLGRKKSADPRDRNYLARDALSDVAVSMPVNFDGARRVRSGKSAAPVWALDLPRLYRHHKRSPLFPLDQDGWSACVGYTYGALVLAGPTMQQRALMDAVAASPFDTLDEFLRREWYLGAQQLDEWAGQEPEYYGTSMRAGAKVGQRLGFWPNYWWLTSPEEVYRYLILHGPVPIGVDWFTGMFAVDRNGFLSVSGEWEGGHAMLVDQVNITQKYIGGPQSWGRRPYARWKFHFDDFGYLLRSGGDALAIPEVRVPKAA